MRTLDRLFIGAVLAHFSVVIVHSVSHLVLGIVPAPLDATFLVVVIVAGPPALLPVLRWNRSLALALVAVLMGAAAVYGSYSHFVAAGPDHVSLASEPWTGVFVASAALLGVLEVASVFVAVVALFAATRTPSAPAGPPA